jgi:hypothetical protein
VVLAVALGFACATKTEKPAPAAPDGVPLGTAETPAASSGRKSAAKEGMPPELLAEVVAVCAPGAATLSDQVLRKVDAMSKAFEKQKKRGEKITRDGSEKLARDTGFADLAEAVKALRAAEFYVSLAIDQHHFQLAKQLNDPAMAESVRAALKEKCARGGYAAKDVELLDAYRETCAQAMRVLAALTAERLTK